MHAISILFLAYLCLLREIISNETCPDDLFLDRITNTELRYSAAQCTAPGAYSQGYRDDSNYPRYDRFSLSATTLFPEDGLTTMISCSLSSAISIARLSEPKERQFCTVGNGCIIQETCNLSQAQKCWLALNDTDTFASHACPTPELKFCWENTDVWAKYSYCITNVSAFSDACGCGKSMRSSPRCSIREATQEVTYQRIGTCGTGTLRPRQDCELVCGDDISPGTRLLRCDASGSFKDLGCKKLFTITRHHSKSDANLELAWVLNFCLAIALITTIVYLIALKCGFYTNIMDRFPSSGVTRIPQDIYGENAL